jgi:cytochrome P450
MSCPGQNLAKMELSKICGTIIRDYDIRLVEPEKEWKWMAYFTMVPHDWPVYISKRSLDEGRRSGADVESNTIG